MKLAVSLASGGLDSTTLAYFLRNESYEPLLLSVDYGQRHAREIEAAMVVAARLGVEHNVVDLRGLRALLSGSALTDPDVAVPYGHYAADNMRITVVPNRNAILLSVAFGMAVARGASVVAAAMHAGDHAIYPDCRPQFVSAFNAMEKLATEGFGDPDLQFRAPFVEMTKADIVKLGDQLGVPFAYTWSCYEGGARHCGQCGTCVERREAFQLAGVTDPTEYLAESALV
jgi:7-cyano-7-deazaguanine synthase